jgi:glucose-6-phosphate isomerase
MSLRLDFTNMFSPAVSDGITDAEWGDAADRFRGAYDAVMARHARGELGFFDLAAHRSLRDPSAPMSHIIPPRPGAYTDVVVLGIGGSALGPVALRTALRASSWNTLDERARGGWPRMHVLDNVDPETITALLGRLDLKASLFVVTSKSGGTAETMAQYLIVRDRLQRARVASLGDHIVFVTDPEKGALRQIARHEGIPAFEIPANVGGRFSVLSPVGILPAALVGIDVAALLDGAADMVRRCEVAELAKNPAGAFGVLQWLSDAKHGKHINVLMPYSDPLRDFAAWFVQLWAESLGKISPDGTHVGPTPIASLGATDQHSQVQLFMEGPADKTITFIAVRERATDVTIPALHSDIPELAYLAGHSLAELIDIEQRATAGALARRGRPNMTISLDRVDPWHVGGLIMMLEIATAYAGELYGINAYDQPGVELGKQFAYAMLGRPGADAARHEWEQLPKSDPRRTM